MLDRTFDYGAAEGTCNSCAGCKPSSYTCGSSGQLAIASGTWCNSYPSQSITYEKAGISSITVKSNKSLVGVGSKGVIKGKGLRFVSGVSNIIVQNVHITDLNPEYIWWVTQSRSWEICHWCVSLPLSFFFRGGDALTLDGSSKIWIDRVTTSLIGRQHIVFGKLPLASSQARSPFTELKVLHPFLLPIFFPILLPTLSTLSGYGQWVLPPSESGK